MGIWRGFRRRIEELGLHLIGGSAGARTQDQYLKRVLLYQLSYRPGNKMMPFAEGKGGALPAGGAHDTPRPGIRKTVSLTAALRHGRPAQYSPGASPGTSPGASYPFGAFAGIRFNRSAANREASLSGYFTVTSVSVFRASG